MFRGRGGYGGWSQPPPRSHPSYVARPHHLSDLQNRNPGIPPTYRPVPEGYDRQNVYAYDGRGRRPDYDRQQRSPDDHHRRMRSPDHRNVRSPMRDARDSYRGRSPNRHDSARSGHDRRSFSGSPEQHGFHDRSPDRGDLCRQSTDRRDYPRRSPERRDHARRSPDGHGSPSRTYERREYPRRSAERQNYRRQSPPQHRVKTTPWPDNHIRTIGSVSPRRDEVRDGNLDYHVHRRRSEDRRGSHGRSDFRNSSSGRRSPDSRNARVRSPQGGRRVEQRPAQQRSFEASVGVGKSLDRSARSDPRHVRAPSADRHRPSSRAGDDSRAISQRNERVRSRSPVIRRHESASKQGRSSPGLSKSGSRNRRETLRKEKQASRAEIEKPKVDEKREEEERKKQEEERRRVEEARRLVEEAMKKRDEEAMKKRDEENKKKHEEQEKYRKFKEAYEAGLTENLKKWESYDQDTFESHPLYTQEWTRFYKRRYGELKMEGKVDALTYNYTRDWKNFWLGHRIQELKQADVESIREKILAAHGYASMPLAPGSKSSSPVDVPSPVSSLPFSPEQIILSDDSDGENSGAQKPKRAKKDGGRKDSGGNKEVRSSLAQRLQIRVPLIPENGEEAEEERASEEAEKAKVANSQKEPPVASGASEKSVASVASEKPVDTATAEKAVDSAASEKAVATSSPEKVVADVAPEKPVDSAAPPKTSNQRLEAVESQKETVATQPSKEAVPDSAKSQVNKIAPEPEKLSDTEVTREFSKSPVNAVAQEAPKLPAKAVARVSPLVPSKEAPVEPQNTLVKPPVKVPSFADMMLESIKALLCFRELLPTYADKLQKICEKAVEVRCYDGDKGFVRVGWTDETWKYLKLSSVKLLGAVEMGCVNDDAREQAMSAIQTVNEMLKEAESVPRNPTVADEPVEPQQLPATQEHRIILGIDIEEMAQKIGTKSETEGAQLLMMELMQKQTVKDLDQQKDALKELTDAIEERRKALFGDVRDGGLGTPGPSESSGKIPDGAQGTPNQNESNNPEEQLEDFDSFTPEDFARKYLFHFKAWPKSVQREIVTYLREIEIKDPPRAQAFTENLNELQAASAPPKANVAPKPSAPLPSANTIQPLPIARPVPTSSNSNSNSSVSPVAASGASNTPVRLTAQPQAEAHNLDLSLNAMREVEDGSTMSFDQIFGTASQIAQQRFSKDNTQSSDWDEL